MKATALDQSRQDLEGPGFFDIDSATAFHQRSHGFGNTLQQTLDQLGLCFEDTL